MSDRNGMLGARAPADRARLERLVGNGAAGFRTAGGGQLDAARHSPVLSPFVVHVKPVSVPQPDYGARHVAALVLICRAGGASSASAPSLVARALKLTPAEAEVAVGLAEGRSVRDMAEATGHTEDAIYWHLKRIYRKQSLSRQVDLVRLVLSLAELG